MRYIGNVLIGMGTAMCGFPIYTIDKGFSLTNFLVLVGVIVVYELILFVGGILYEEYK